MSKREKSRNTCRIRRGCGPCWGVEHGYKGRRFANTERRRMLFFFGTCRNLQNIIAWRLHFNSSRISLRNTTVMFPVEKCVSVCTFLFSLPRPLGSYLHMRSGSRCLSYLSKISRPCSSTLGQVERFRWKDHCPCSTCSTESEDPLVLVPRVPRRSGDPLLPVPLVPLVPTCAICAIWLYYLNLCQLSFLRFFFGFLNVIPFLEKLF